MVDPDLVELEDGTLGLTVLDGFDRPGSPGPICHLRSTDGQEFFTHSTMLDLEERFDPSVVVVQDRWWLAVGIPADEDSVTVRGSWYLQPTLALSAAVVFDYLDTSEESYQLGVTYRF